MVSHDLDALRAFAMLLGIVLLGLLSFIETPMWAANDRYQNNEIYSLIVHAIHGFRMQLFFLISGFFTAMLWQKRGLKGALQFVCRHLCMVDDHWFHRLLQTFFHCRESAASLPVRLCLLVVSCALTGHDGRADHRQRPGGPGFDQARANLFQRDRFVIAHL